MQLLNLMARVMGTVHRIMTVAVKQHKVGTLVVRAVPILMMGFEPILRGKGQATPSTFTVLSLPELLVLWWKAGIVVPRGRSRGSAGPRSGGRGWWPGPDNSTGKRVRRAGVGLDRRGHRGGEPARRSLWAGAPSGGGRRGLAPLGRQSDGP